MRVDSWGTSAGYAALAASIEPKGEVTVECVKGQAGVARGDGTMTGVKVGTLHQR